MRHALLLRTLTLPVIVSLVVCFAIVATHPMRVDPVLADQPSAKNISAPDSIVAVQPDAGPSGVKSVDAIAPTLPVGVTSGPEELADENALSLDSTTTPSAGGGLEEVSALAGEETQPTGPDAFAEESRGAVPDRPAGADLESATNVGKSGDHSKQPETAQATEIVDPAAKITSWLQGASKLRASVESASETPRSAGASEASASITAKEPDDVRPTSPAPTTPPTPTTIRIVNPASNRYPVAFVLGSEVKNLGPGAELEIPKEQATVRFDRGNNQGIESIDLRIGTYEFSLAPSGWSLSNRDRVDP